MESKNCKECGELKVLGEFYSHPLTKDGVMGRCMECVKNGRKTDSERVLARINDKKRSFNCDRRKYSTERCRQYRVSSKEKYEAHKFVGNFLRGKSRIPNVCCECFSCENIHLHHTDYEYKDIIVPLCAMCHKKVHYGKIQVNEKNIISIRDINIT